jgi:hypothetical protein
MNIVSYNWLSEIRILYNSLKAENSSMHLYDKVTQVWYYNGNSYKWVGLRL